MLDSTLLDIQGVSKRFGGLQAISEVDLTVQTGEIVGLIGPNGSGKTTLFNVMTGVLAPETGSIKYKGREIVELSAYQVCQLGIARTYQNVRPFQQLTVLQNVLVACANRADWDGNLRCVKEEARELLNLVGLAAFADVEARHLNLFQRKKIELVRALGARPALLLLDEVMAGLNATEADRAVELIRTLHQQFGMAIIAIEHIMRIIMTMSDRIIVLDRGRKIADGVPLEIAANADVRRAYLGDEVAQG